MLGRFLEKRVVAQELKPLRFSRKVLTKGYITTLKTLNRFFSKMAERWTLIPLLKYSPGRVLYYKKKNLIEIGDPQLACSPCQIAARKISENEAKQVLNTFKYHVSCTDGKI